MSILLYYLSPVHSNEMAGEDLDDVPLTLKEAMEQLGLDDYLAVLEKEQIDLDSLVGSI